MSALPYPHACNDCQVCRERDADFEVHAKDPVTPPALSVAAVPAAPRPIACHPGSPAGRPRRDDLGVGAHIRQMEDEAAAAHKLADANTAATASSRKLAEANARQ